jgi:hypothetical protein
MSGCFLPTVGGAWSLYLIHFGGPVVADSVGRIVTSEGLPAFVYT